MTRINGQNFQVNVDNLIRGYHAFNPPRPDLMKRYYERGMLDTIRFLQRKNYYRPAPNEGSPGALSLNCAETVSCKLGNPGDSSQAKNQDSPDSFPDPPSGNSHEMPKMHNEDNSDSPADSNERKGQMNNNSKASINNNEKNKHTCHSISLESQSETWDMKKDGSQSISNLSGVVLYESTL